MWAVALDIFWGLSLKPSAFGLGLVRVVFMYDLRGYKGCKNLGCMQGGPAHTSKPHTNSTKSVVCRGLNCGCQF